MPSPLGQASISAARSARFSPKEPAALRSAIRSSTQAPLDERATLSPQWMLAGLLLIGLVIRLLLIGADGFHGDVSSFEAWSLSLVDLPISQFYDKAGFADYPPGYLYVLFVIGHLYRLLVHDDPSYFMLKVFVKMPAIVCDLVDAGLIFALVRKFAPLSWAFAAAALMAFNPSTIFISAYWGQVDSVAAALTLGSLLLMVNAYASSGRSATLMIVGAWLALGYSVLMKPPAIVIAPIFLLFAFIATDRKARVDRLIATWYGVAAALVLAYLASIPFHPGINPIEQFAWLVKRYAFGANVYAYNSVNAFNLYEMFPNSRFWQPDTGILPGWPVGTAVLGFPQYIWGIIIFAAATVLVASRFAQRRDVMALLEASMILSLGYFVLSTRMHERYIFNAMVLAIPLVFYRRRYFFATVILTLTLFGNLFYSLDYLHVMDSKTPIPGVDAANLHPFLSHISALLNVGTFFYLGYAFLGTGEDALQTYDFATIGSRVSVAMRRWFSPREGIVAMTVRDWWIASGLAVGSFVLSFVDYTWPSEKIFDEIYYARAGEEYLTHKEIFEFTHPPLTKLWVTLSMILFGGMNGGGDTAAGWRFLNLVMGALMVFVLYVFAKRLLGSTLFATIAACLLLFDGFHYVQSRIATPEITVAFFTLLTLYAFYRFWIASQVRVFPKVTKVGLQAQGIVLALGFVVAAGFSAVIASGQDVVTHVVAFIYLGSGIYAFTRLLVPRFVRSRAMASYADGSYVVDGALVTMDGGRVPVDKGALVPGESTTVGKSVLVHSDGDLNIEYARGGKVAYTTPDGAATFSPEGTMTVGNATIDGSRDWLIWLVVLALSAGCLGSSKWNGLFDFFVIWGLATAVTLQRYWTPALRAMGVKDRKIMPASWGNPLGFSLDIVVTTMLFIGGTIYLLCYIPYFGLGHNFGDLVGLQKQMFGYHYDLTATHPYGSKWWQWPILERPISYYYHDFRAGTAAQDPTACCVAEILALPNPLNWWSGLISVPVIAVLAFREKNKGYLLLVVAYLLQWLPWALSPRVSFEYHFFPNLAIICLANAVCLQRLWKMGEKYATAWSMPRYVVLGYCTSIFIVFAFFFPILAGLHVPWNVWDARMLHFLMGYKWV
jgi:predicted membrane-bound dolichyl-phosphate-mannose-protein mannosyltransferase